MDLPDPDLSMPVSCAWIEDGQCDEPTQCSLGSDEVDCLAQCAQNPPSFLEGVCQYYESRSGFDDASVQLSQVNPNLPLGHQSGVLMFPSGANPSVLVPRHYRAYIPPSIHTQESIPLVFMLPGHRVALDPLAHYTQLIATADVEGFIVVFVEQEFREDLRWAWWTDWNWSVPSNAENHPDLTVLESLIDHLDQTYPINRSRVYVSGHSRGGAMALIAAIERPDLFRGAVIQSGFTEFRYDLRLRLPQNQDPPDLVFIHGDLDPDICISCEPDQTCLLTRRSCGSVYGADGLVDLLSELGWTDDHLIYYRLEGVTHRWQPQFNSIWWKWFSDRHTDGDTEDVRYAISPDVWPLSAPSASQACLLYTSPSPRD